MHTRPLRLILKRWKALYIVGCWLLTFGLVWLAAPLLPEPMLQTLATVLEFGWIYYGTRIFRGREELLVVPRPWWRMTARPRAGFLLGPLFLFGAAQAVLFLFAQPGWAWATSLVEYAALAALYLGSSITLARRRRAPSVPKLSE
ncbi:hypothetical protein [Antiquaquibacter soli]|uniref:Uncharacterized protein n=1 Tax=Antiquaquibacter soli TaxID=3064523 RepID=A0ABT9BQ68_9MICO|nr:hypothetical protein [Protaetiibacter sp. WY-16]MDO7883130.1 hypothetical protein [Protaetiibacter sp. WY-16]